MSTNLNIEQQAERLRQARALLAPIIANPHTEPQIEAVVRSADRELHWALWNLGLPVSHRPELPEDR